MSATQELAEAVRARAQGTPYVVEPTPSGFDVRLALEDPQWFGTFREWRLVQASVHHVRTEEARRTVGVEDELRTLTWQAGVDGRERPTLGAAVGVQRGRVVSKSVQRTYSLGGGGLRKESERSFDSGVGRRLVEDSAKALGWKQERSLNEKIGLYVGLGTIALLVLAGIVVGIVALAGGFG
ncbi:hypothetical protein [Microlunatus flavus]|uniref:Uncharacterized protein n=1 Tax=Microlunatus flavus TaxID=1036181 RepID=A0A1H9HDC0_9ACTN|nr:hypothetical protein [Microlunatus flavus]SEQ60343.1 hypothetical protein SAMN05421756_104208 [Microlunatus flavus]